MAAFGVTRTSPSYDIIAISIAIVKLILNIVFTITKMKLYDH